METGLGDPSSPSTQKDPEVPTRVPIGNEKMIDVEVIQQEQN